jgi:hypothetical protein
MKSLGLAGMAWTWDLVYCKGVQVLFMLFLPFLFLLPLFDWLYVFYVIFPCLAFTGLWVGSMESGIHTRHVAYARMQPKGNSVLKAAFCERL